MYRRPDPATPQGPASLPATVQALSRRLVALVASMSASMSTSMSTSLIKPLTGFWLARARRRADREALRQMSDHQLRDLGIGRGEIEHVTSTRPGADTR